MLKRIGVLCVCMLLPRTALAETIVSFTEGLVTWQASGAITGSSTTNPSLPIPPIGTPYTLTLTFNPSTAVRTIGGCCPPPPPECVTVNASGSFEIGGVSFAGTAQGFTHAELFGGRTCVGASGGFTEFLFSLPPADESPWNSPNIPMMLVASYRDLLVDDAFPEVPSGVGSLRIQTGFLPQIIWGVNGPFAPMAINVEQPAAVPEPGTLALFGLGLAGAARRFRTRRS